MALKSPALHREAVGFESGDLARAETILRHARQAAGLAAYHYFFHEATTLARAAYLSALEAETEAELLLASLRGENG